MGNNLHAKRRFGDSFVTCCLVETAHLCLPRQGVCRAIIHFYTNSGVHEDGLLTMMEGSHQVHAHILGESFVASDDDWQALSASCEEKWSAKQRQ